MLPGAAAGPGLVPVGLGTVPVQARYGVVFASHGSYIEQVVSRGTLVFRLFKVISHVTDI